MSICRQVKSERGVIYIKEDILYLILQAEKEYQTAVKNAEKEGGQYVDDCKEKQTAYFEELKREWYLFAKAENEKYIKKLYDDEQRMELEIEKSKEQLKACQTKKIDVISERLKMEVLSPYGNS